MMRSLFSGVSGLKNHQTRMDVIGNNIANVNTTGFKASRVNFQDILSQTLQGASAAQGNTSGTNPMQIGLGMGLASIDTLFTDGSVQSTGKQTDLAIQGQGFFVVSDNGGTNQYYTRAGNFDFDSAGNYNLPGTGLQVMGYDVDKATGVVDTSKLVPITITEAEKTMPPKASSDLTFTNNLSADAVAASAGPPAVAATMVTGTFTVYDSLSKEHTINTTFTKTASNTWSFAATDAAGTTLTVSPSSSTIKFKTDGTIDTTSLPTQIAYSPTGANAMTLKLDFSGLTQYGGESTLKTNADGYPQGSLTKTTIGSTGRITGTFDNGQSQDLGQVALASFTNPAGLDKAGETLFVKSSNSGTVSVGIPGSGGMGSTTSGSLEMSNVNLSDEFSNMIITQRGFQANSKIITTSDEMLEILANLKR